MNAIMQFTMMINSEIIQLFFYIYWLSDW